ncbi:NosD domain-containing protein [Bacillus spongiae]|uniref:NosD domain-containing protein n=1 Tax=Bacillus spongiae TaxID=2683610 RepID=A0ABU8HBB8_9BACI
MNTSKDKFSITALLFTFTGILFIGVVIVVGIILFNEKTIVVPDDEDTIQSAVDAAVPGDIILVKPKVDGTAYEENVEIKTDNIKLIGVGKEKPVLDGDFMTSTGRGIDLTDRSGVLLQNFIVQNFEDEGIFLDGSNRNMIKKNFVTENVVGINFIGSNNNMVKGNNSNENSDQGIFLVDSNQNMVKGNTFNENGQGISLASSNQNMMKSNTANDNESDGIFLDDSYRNIVKGNTFNENGQGISSARSNQNMIKGNTANENERDGIFLEATSINNDLFFNRAFGNGDLDIEDEDDNNFKGNKCDTSDPVGLCN